MGVIKKLFKSFSEKEVRKIQPLVDKVFALESEMEALTDEQLRHKTVEFKEQLAEGKTLDDILPEAFAVVREAAWRVLGMKPYRVQVIGGIVLHQGRIAEMKTGEGKTLVATMPSYLNALAGKGVHVVTVNDYLAKRDSEWMGKVHEFLGLKVGCVVYGLDTEERQAAYNADITYGTNNQYGFDYLRDNMAIYKDGVVQRDLFYAIVDEVDSILIDEARTPLIISGEGDKSTEMYSIADRFVQTLTGRILDPNEDSVSKLDALTREYKEETVDFIVDEKHKTANLTEKGNAKAEAFFHVDNISDPQHMELNHYLNQALKARHTMKRDIDYVVSPEGEILIVDEFTGRIMQGRRYSDGLHQAIEAKEQVEVKSESKTLATITFQNYFRMYQKLSGMTGTAMTEQDEFSEIYHMDVIAIPTNRPVIRQDRNDLVYVNQEAKYRAIVEKIKEVHATGQPILVGTVSIEISELISSMLKKAGVKHSVLNAKQHEKEAEIVAQAGRLGTITIATNMAGRGTDIVLGGNPDYAAKQELKRQGMTDELIEWADSFTKVEPGDMLQIGTEESPQFVSGEDVEKARERYRNLREEFKKVTDEEAKKVVEVGGLYILGTERHESRRIDNQLRGRSGRQGDPGESCFFISLEDNLVRIFGGEKMQSVMKTLMSGRGFDENEPIQAKLLTSSIERAQKKVEANNFGTRKRVLQYDDVMNVQRETIYTERKRVLDGENMRDEIVGMIDEVICKAVDSFCADGVPAEQWELEGLFNYLNNLFLPKGFLAVETVQNMKKQELKDQLLEIAHKLYDIKEEEMGFDSMRELERIVLLRVIDTKWMDHIDAMDQLKQGIGIRAFGNEDPVRAYANEGYDMFAEMNQAIQEETVRLIYHIVPATAIRREQVAHPTKESGAEESEESVSQTIRRSGKKIGRNDPCPCGSGKKYKHCHGKNL